MNFYWSEIQEYVMEGVGFNINGFESGSLLEYVTSFAYKKSALPYRSSAGSTY